MDMTNTNKTFNRFNDNNDIMVTYYMFQIEEHTIFLKILQSETNKNKIHNAIFTDSTDANILKIMNITVDSDILFINKNSQNSSESQESIESDITQLVQILWERFFLLTMELVVGRFIDQHSKVEKSNCGCSGEVSNKTKKEGIFTRLWNWFKFQ